MSHQPYEDWLFSEQPLSPQDNADLQEHLHNCETCCRLDQAWSHVSVQLNTSNMVEPQVGFVNRWQQHYAIAAKRSERRQSIYIFAGSLVAAVVLLSLIVFFAWPLLQSPKVLLWTYIYQILGWFSVATLARDFTSTLVESTIGGITWIWLALAAGVLTELCVLWVVSIRFLTSPRRVNL